MSNEQEPTDWTNPKPGWWQKPTDRDQRMDRILACLREDARMSLAEIARRTDIPITTVFDAMKQIKQRFWFTAVFLDTRARQVRTQTMRHPTARHPRLVEVVA